MRVVITKHLGKKRLYILVTYVSVSLATKTCQ